MKSVKICRSLCESLALFCLVASPVSAAGETTLLRGSIIDHETGAPVPARLYIESGDGHHFLARSDGGTAIHYEKKREEKSVEIHTSLSAHPFEVDLVPGLYKLTVERGKEYFPVTTAIRIGESSEEIEIPIRRWIDMNKLGWYSGETHVHRPIEDLKTLMLCEDLNVGLPLTAWVSKAEDTPLKNNRNEEPIPPAEVIRIDDTHVIWPLNTEYEIGRIGDKSHTFGALFVLNHKEPLDIAAPPVSRVAIEARKQGALLDLDKHNWPWSLMLIPAIRVDLFELTNNHIWRTEFAFKTFHSEATADYMEIEKDGTGFTEGGWIDFGFKTYYALLNCGFDIKPSAGTASGVHPVPLGFGRVYVKLDGPFQYESWINGLRDGRSFVTTGPMLAVQFNGKNPGARFAVSDSDQGSVRVNGDASSLHPLKSIEIIVNGEIARSIPPPEVEGDQRPISMSFDTLIPVPDSSWIAVRTCEDRPDGRPRFAHTAPVHVEVPGRPLLPKRDEVNYFIKRIQEEISRNEPVVSKPMLDEYHKAARHYESLLEKAR